MTSADVNAYYYRPRANQMVFFLAGILRPPFFSKEYDPARNCGSFRSTVGHELAHGFDDTGRHYDASGTLHYWWRSNETAHEFTKRTQCLVEQYGRYNVSSTTDPTHVLCHVNGQYTLSENIADMAGSISRSTRIKRLGPQITPEAYTLLYNGTELAHLSVILMRYSNVDCFSHNPKTMTTQNEVAAINPCAPACGGIIVSFLNSFYPLDPDLYSCRQVCASHSSPSASYDHSPSLRHWLPNEQQVSHPYNPR
ncbi:hypothetical protein PsorP6_013943 [Peronosclerospora sorghi]|uniref:Uncharacterized protein n=1 Tax=Peronosclerospora sorghi TaxID=230839 RepID=A0ACC0VH16_9STRA|nr:hypothetical protein PsorP6_013943 [Peronosclerospora sorghi]